MINKGLLGIGDRSCCRLHCSVLAERRPAARTAPIALFGNVLLTLAKKSPFVDTTLREAVGFS
jgi:hypothetical protein